jgi:hypothetical protein
MCMSFKSNLCHRTIKYAIKCVRWYRYVTKCIPSKTNIWV